jgi:hypothetical protein
VEWSLYTRCMWLGCSVVRFVAPDGQLALSHKQLVAFSPPTPTSARAMLYIWFGPLLA